MAVNKVVYGGNTLVDLTGDTVTADKLMQGYTAHDKTGTVIIGTATGGSAVVHQDEDGYIVLDDEPGETPTITSLSVTENGTYTAPTGVAYSPVTVNVSGGSSDFSTVQVAITTAQQMAANVDFIAFTIEYDSLQYFSHTVGRGHSRTYEVVLYKEFGGMTITSSINLHVSATGNATVQDNDTDMVYIEITGDCSLAISGV